MARRKRPTRKAAPKRTNSNISAAQKAAAEARKTRADEVQAKKEQGKPAPTAPRTVNVIDPRTGLVVPAPTGPARPGDPVGRGAYLASQGKSDGKPKKPDPIFKGAAEETRKLAGLTSGLMEKRTEERRKLADTTLYGGGDKDRAAKLAERSLAYAEARTQQILANKGAAVWMGTTKKAVKLRNRGPERMDEGGGSTTDTVVELADVRTKDELMSWLADEAEFNKIKAAANKAGIDAQSYDDVAKVWKSVVDQAAATYSTTGKKVTPWALLQLRGKTMKNGKPASKTTTSTSIDEMDPAEAKMMIRNAAGQALGRDPTKEEIEDFIAKAQTIAQRNPNVTTTTTNYGFDGEPVSQSSVSKGGGDAVTAQAQDAAIEQAKQSEDYTAYQAAGVYMPWLMDALASPI